MCRFKTFKLIRQTQKIYNVVIPIYDDILVRESNFSAGFGVYAGDNQLLPHQESSSGIAPKTATIHRAHLPASSADC